jgi:hypothetical protein
VVLAGRQRAYVAVAASDGSSVPEGRREAAYLSLCKVFDCKQSTRVAAAPARAESISSASGQQQLSAARSSRGRKRGGGESDSQGRAAKKKR